jgi:hypothetical protein
MPLLLNSQFMTVPSGTTAQRPASPTVGMMRFNTDINDYEVFKTTVGWASLDAELSPISGINNGAFPHSIVNVGGTGLQGQGTTNGVPNNATAPSLGRTDGFATHGGHTGSNSYPMYWAVHFNGVKRAINQLTVMIHANSWGYFRLEASNNSGVGSTFANTGTWTALTFSNSTNGFNNQNMGGNESGLSEGTQFTYNYTNNIAYAAYRIVILDSARRNESPGARYNGSAGYFWRLSRA